jgi:hypothetical protein
MGALGTVLGNDQGVAHRERVNVQERQHVVVLIHLHGGNGSGDDFAKDALFDV